MFPWNSFPFNKKFHNQMGQFNPNEIEKFVKDMMGQMIPSPDQLQEMMNARNGMQSTPNQQNQGTNQSNPTTMPYSVFETHNYVFVRIMIKDDDWLSELKLYHTTNQLIIENIPEINKITITLPAIIRKKGAKAIYRDNILEIKFIKMIDMQFSEIEITEDHL